MCYKLDVGYPQRRYHSLNYDFRVVNATLRLLIATKAITKVERFRDIASF